MIFFRLCYLLFVGIFLLTANVVAQEEKPLRTWRAAEGGYTVKARMIEASEDSVTLEKENGERITVALKLLSDTDQQYVEQQPDPGRRPSRNSGEMDYANVEILKADREIAWREFQAGSRPQKIELSQTAVFEINGETGNWNRLITDPSGTKLLYGADLHRTGIRRIFDLATGKQVGGEFELPAGYLPVALSDDLKSLIVTTTSPFDKKLAWLRASTSGVEAKLAWRFFARSFRVLVVCRICR